MDGRRIRNLGDVTWDVTILSGDASQRATVSATARMWQDQLIVRKPIAYHQTIRAEELADAHREQANFVHGEIGIGNADFLKSQRTSPLHDRRRERGPIMVRVGRGRRNRFVHAH